MEIAYLCTLIICLFIGQLTKKENRFKKYILPIMVMIFLIILMGGSIDNPDSEIYKNMYNRGTLSKGLGFELIIKICHIIGLSYEQFRVVIALLGYILINFTVKKFTFNRYVFYFLYFIYPFWFDAVQIRNFLAMSIFIFALQFLIDTDKTKEIRNIIIYITLILIASSVQIVALVYLPLIFIKYFGKNKILRVAIIFIILLSIIIGMNKTMVVNILNQYSLFFLEQLDGVGNYLEINNRFGWILNWIQQFGNFILVSMALKYYKKNEENLNPIDKDKKIKIRKFIDFTYKINLYMFLFLPLLAIDENYTRIIRNVMPINLIVFSSVFFIHYYKFKNKPKNKMSIRFNSTIFYIICYQLFLFWLMARTYWDSIIISLFNSNWIF